MTATQQTGTIHPFSPTLCCISGKGLCTFRHFPLENHSSLPRRLYGRSRWSWL